MMSFGIIHVTRKFQNIICILLFTDSDDDKVDGSVKLMAAGGNGFKVMVKPPVCKGLYR